MVNAMPHEEFGSIKYLAEEELSAPSLNTTYSALGVDISVAVTESNYACMKSNGYSFAIPRAFRSTGSPDTNACANIKNAHTAGFTRADVYIFPCATCGTTGASQILSMVNSLKSAGCNPTSGSQTGGQWGQIWLDIEGTQYWSSSTTTNQNFFNSMASECNTLGIPWGTYTSSSQWNPIMGSSFTGGSAHQLWWAHWVSSPCTGTFSSFGGWNKYYMEQWAGDVTLCSTSVDKNCIA